MKIRNTEFGMRIIRMVGLWRRRFRIPHSALGITLLLLPLVIGATLLNSVYDRSTRQIVQPTNAWIGSLGVTGVLNAARVNATNLTVTGPQTNLSTLTNVGKADFGGAVTVAGSQTNFTNLNLVATMATDTGIYLSASNSTVQSYIRQTLTPGDTNELLQIGVGVTPGNNQSIAGKAGITTQMERYWANAGDPLSEWWIGVQETNGWPMVRTFMMQYQHSTHQINWSTVASKTNTIVFRFQGRSPSFIISDLNARNDELVFSGIGQQDWGIRDSVGFNGSTIHDGLLFDNESQGKVQMVVLRYGGLAIADGGVPGSANFAWLRCLTNGVLKVSGPSNEVGLLLVSNINSSIATFTNGVFYPTNTVLPTAAQLGVGGHWVGNSNGNLIALYSLNGTGTLMKVLAP